jgi:hypothetical protein
MTGKKIILLIVLALGALLLCCVVLGVAGVLYFNTTIESAAKSIKADVLTAVCESHGDITGSDTKFFTDSFMNNYGVGDASTAIGKTFPATYKCADLLPGNIITLIMNGQSLNVNSSLNTGDTAVVTVRSADGKTNSTINLVKVDTVWKIDSITVK